MTNTDSNCDSAPAVAQRHYVVVVSATPLPNCLHSEPFNRLTQRLQLLSDQPPACLDDHRAVLQYDDGLHSDVRSLALCRRERKNLRIIPSQELYNQEIGRTWHSSLTRKSGLPKSMNRTITRFMWGYQIHFCFGQESAAARVCQALDPRFHPLVFLVGILQEDRKDRHLACVEPEDHFWIQSAAFDRLGDHVPEILASYPESRLLQSHLAAQKRQSDRLFRRAPR
jgi:hypothetical protein